eukprot:GHRR01025081.1.p1 GENE.GHRR01025081.1~~GHRR01025081.1.p1  ORF type:complete len:132 (+),score=13.55 GHRR01025081.1:725-1120(+)
MAASCMPSSWICRPCCNLTTTGRAFVCRSREQSYLYHLYLLADSTQHSLAKSIEFIRAAPGATTQQAHKNAAHGTYVKLFITIKNKDLHESQQNQQVVTGCTVFAMACLCLWPDVCTSMAGHDMVKHADLD